MCKNWTESGFCRYGLKCQYAHGAEELAEIDRITEAQARLNDKYKSQNCRQFYREKLCPYGKRCHFRHEYRSFKKIHRHYYMAHLAAMSITYEDVLEISKSLPDGTEPNDQFTTTSSDSSFELEKTTIKDQEDETAQIMGYKRLSCFQFATDSAKSKAGDIGSDDYLSIINTQESLC